MNISSLSYNFDQLHSLLSEINISFDIIKITETRLKKQTLRTTNIDINGHNLEQTPTEASCGGILIYVKNKLNYISQKNLKICKKNELESTFLKHLLLQARTLLLDAYTDTCACIRQYSTTYT